MKSIVYSSEILRFVQHAMAYCALVEPDTTPIWTKSTLRQLRDELALVYTTGLMIPEMDTTFAGQSEHTVTEEDYDNVRDHLASIFAEHDGFLDAQQEEMKYSDVPLGRSTSEILADLYQILADMTWIFRQQVEEYMEQAIAETRYTMLTEWGSDLLAVLRQIHTLVSEPDFLGSDEDEEGENENDDSDEWLSEEEF